MKKNLLAIFIVQNLLSLVALASSSDFDIDKSIQGESTTVTRHNLCVKEKAKAYRPILGTIPLVAGALTATDLVCDNDDCGIGIKEGDLLTPFEAKKMFQKRFAQTRCQWTLADLDPKEDEVVWTNKIGSKLSKELDSLEPTDMDKVDFISTAWGRLGNFRVTVNKKNENGTPVQYSLMLSKNVHNYLLRKSLLRKIGYKVPPVKWVKRLRVQFDNQEDVKEFISKLSINNAGSFDRWVLSQSKDFEVTLQDVILMDDQEYDLNLSKGFVSADKAEGKRIYDSLLIPFNLVDVPESINMFDWTFGRVYSSNLVVNYDLAKEFQTSYHDALWITRRIMKLTIKDWWEIVDSSHLPPNVKLLLMEKLKSRRNHLARLLDMNVTEFKVDSKISNGQDLVDGEITREFYDGFSRRFKMPDPESPLVGSKLYSFFKSKAVSYGLSLFTEILNSQKFMGTDIEAKIQDEINEIMSETAAESGVTAAVSKAPVKSYFFPTIHGGLVINREVVAGGYSGTDARLQIADSVGVVMSAGIFGGVTGVYSETGEEVLTADGLVRQKLPVNINLNTSVNTSRMFTHVRPIQSIEQGLNYPFKNVFVPKILKDHGNTFNKLLTDEYQELYQEDPDKGVEKMLNLLNEQISVGESIIITDSLSGEIKGTVGANLYEVIDLKLSAKPKSIILARLHILRKSEDEYHIYRSLGNIHSVELTAGLEKYIPVTKVIFKLSKGKATTKYYRVKIGKLDLEGNENVLRNERIKALGSVFATGSLDSIDTTLKPYKLLHNYDEDSTKFGIFVWRWHWNNQEDEIYVVTPAGKEITVFRRQ
ncbi:MAG: hypothetical protein HON90_12300, partial [Halobacteriovoraceae bacterium]|nr:hypothetical protein [Halobacteriovoraceae bacterium]